MDGFSKSSLNIHFVDCSPKDVEQIKKFCVEGSLKSFLLAILDKSSNKTSKYLGRVVAHTNLYMGCKIEGKYYILFYICVKIFKLCLLRIKEAVALLIISFINIMFGKHFKWY